ncbi:hypothetical protein TrVE_jg13992 [Triparma verrucosa]|uniref:Uncharacterized protein n=1 Tax=Triparma verrucosa TaxID=1606542 RepID=A0A9W7KUD5_9STRA|nr:hypothetical protein TrVE_jg13992 [Triparma verrucosa]
MLSNIRGALGLSRVMSLVRQIPPQTSSSFAGFFPRLTPRLELAGHSLPASTQTATQPLSDLFDALWLAVPKSKISRSKKRMKHGRYKLKNKTNIIRDRITGEWTLRHRLPMNWKMFARADGYGPKVPFFERAAIFLEQEEEKKKLEAGAGDTHSDKETEKRE